MNIFRFIPPWLVAVLLFASGAATGNGAGLFGPDSKSDNIFIAAPILPPTLKRVVLLPLAHDDSPPSLASGCETLYPVLQAELIKTKRFEVVTAGKKSIQTLTGSASWTGAELLPTNFFSSLQQTYGCDAVMFCELTTFHAYAPLTIGWRLKLVDVATQKIIWSADVVFDASDPLVSKSAQEFQKQQQGTQPKPQTFFTRVVGWINHEPVPAEEEPWSVLNSPRYFGQFSTVKLLQTLPER